MPSSRDFIFGPWRAVSVLGVTQILAWGALFYPPVLTVPLIAADHGWPRSFAMGGFSLGLFVGGLCSRYVGATIDRLGGHVVMPIGSLLGAAGLAALVAAPGAATYFAVWMVLGVAMAASLYDPAFATLGRIFGPGARAPITTLTLAGGFASTVSWPVTQYLIDTVGWRGTYLVYAGLLACVAAPLHALALPRERFATAPPPPVLTPEQKPAAFLPAHGLAFILVAAGFAAYAFVPSALSAQLLAIFKRFGLTPDTVVAIGMLFGPSQVLARIVELSFGRHLHPLWIARSAVGLLVVAFALLAIVPFSIAAAAAFAVLYGMANGLLTIARGTVPLALFGAAGYGRLVGRIGGPFLVVQALAPVVVTYVADRASDAAALAVVAVFAVAALVCFSLIRRSQ
ncbi:MAG TPA: MFS transporter [Xanthobacteraceae bacterium]|jgi:MFS family permease|nr:MFS transporter [Xanthobacteraceae bacterium]